MPKYAQYDHTAPSPQPVIGWYDTDAFEYRQLPDKADRIVVPIDQWASRSLTPFVAGGVLVEPPAPSVDQQLANAKSSQIALMEARYGAAIAQPVSFTSAGGIAKSYQADPASIAVLQASIAGCMAAQATPAGFYWVSDDNTRMPFAYSDLTGLAAAIFSHGAVAFAHLQDKKVAILAAVSTTDVSAITW